LVTTTHPSQEKEEIKYEVQYLMLLYIFCDIQTNTFIRLNFILYIKIEKLSEVLFGVRVSYSFTKMFYQYIYIYGAN